MSDLVLVFLGVMAIKDFSAGSGISTPPTAIILELANEVEKVKFEAALAGAFSQYNPVTPTGSPKFTVDGTELRLTVKRT